MEDLLLGSEPQGRFAVTSLACWVLLSLEEFRLPGTHPELATSSPSALAPTPKGHHSSVHVPMVSCGLAGGTLSDATGSHGT
jgi:hypothetical protein